MSCLFDSLGESVGRSGAEMRKIITSYLSTNPKLLDEIDANSIVDWTEGKSLDHYVSEMRNQWTWGGAIEIRAFCELFNAIVSISVSYTGKTFDFECSDTPQFVAHIGYNGGHFHFIENLSEN